MKLSLVAEAVQEAPAKFKFTYLEPPPAGGPGQIRIEIYYTAVCRRPPWSCRWRQRRCRRPWPRTTAARCATTCSPKGDWSSHKCRRPWLMGLRSGQGSPSVQDSCADATWERRHAKVWCVDKSTWVQRKSLCYAGRGQRSGGRSGGGSGMRRKQPPRPPRTGTGRRRMSSRQVRAPCPLHRGDLSLPVDCCVLHMPSHLRSLDCFCNK